MNPILVSIVFVLSLISETQSLSCKDQSNRNVDWFIAYKLPQLSAYEKEYPLMGEGEAFLYMDANSKGDGWQRTKVGLHQEKQAIAYTLAQYYKYSKKSEYFHMMFNDEHACPAASDSDHCKTDGYRAHAKGATIFDDKEGFWFIHSIPAFPAPDDYEFKEKNRKFGQSIFCVTFNTEEALGELAEQWYRYQVSIYTSNLPMKMAQKYPMLSKVLKGRTPSSKVSKSRIAKLKSQGGLDLTHFAKSRKWNKNLYKDLVAPNVNANLFTETWLRGLGDLKSGCNVPESDYKVWNIREVNPGKLAFNSGNDHSKWAISDNSTNPIVCIGGINSQRSQALRGGGTMCFSDKTVWQTFYDSIKLVETCVDQGKEGYQIAGQLESVDHIEQTSGCDNSLGDDECNQLMKALKGIDQKAYFCDEVGARLCKLACGICTPESK